MTILSDNMILVTYERSYYIKISPANNQIYIRVFEISASITLNKYFENESKLITLDLVYTETSDIMKRFKIPFYIY